MSNEVYYRMLNTAEVIKPGDLYWHGQRHAWEPVSKARTGVGYDPASFQPIKRRYELSPGGKVKDFVKKKTKSKAFDLRKLRKPKHLLIKNAAGLFDVKFDPKKMSPSKDHAYMIYPDGKGTWINTNVLESCIVEYIDDFGQEIS